MFDFIFKRPTATPASASGPTPEQRADQRETQVRQVRAREDALAAAEALTGDEAAAVAFLLNCEFADARLKAAEHVHSGPMLEQVLQTMRNADRRVAKLMQKRLDAIQQQVVWQRQAQSCVDDALRLAQESQLVPNQVADLDRAWRAIGNAPASLRSAFDQVRAELRDRLEAQAALQRAIIDSLARLRAAREMAETVAHEESARTLDLLEQEMAQHSASRETPSLPKHLMPEFVLQHNSFKQLLVALAARQEAASVRREALAGWESIPLAELKAEVLKREWNALPKLDEGELQSSLQARFDVLLDRTREARPAKPSPAAKPDGDLRQQFAHALDGLEKALQDGALQMASDHDKALRAIDLKGAHLSDALAAQLARARAELGRLQGWAKWGGNVSREELFKAADALPAQALAAPELAKKVGSLRERWKSLDGSAGPAAKELWERFDAACSTAYAPAAAHFKKLAEERQHNLAKAQSMIDEVRQFVIASNCSAEDTSAVDWKAVANFCGPMRQAWQRLGTIDRKEKKRLDAEFDAAMQAVSGPLQRQREFEIERREKLIAQAVGLNPSDRSAVDTLRGLQERWQELAKSMPLARKDEQDLWQRFRGACDAVFAKRKESAVAADAERQQQLQAREALCAALEAALDAPEAAIATTLRESKEAWANFGPVPRASEPQIEARHKSAVLALQQRLDATRRAKEAAELHALRDKLVLCQRLEQTIANGAASDQDNPEAWRAKWQALPALSSEFERVLGRRFDAAINALQSDASRYATVLEQNGASLAQELLRLEIMTGIESPAEMSRERLRLQVEVLQSSLKAGQKPLARDAQLLRLCSLAALADAQSVSRIERLIGVVTGSSGRA